jgi:hypothetical protein
MTTDLAQVALEFARECLGWEKAYHDAFFGRIGEGSHPLPGTRSLDYTDLNAVISAAQKWCNRTMSGLTLEYMPRQEGFGAYCEGNDTWDANPCHALMAACVEASRKLKAA